MRNSVIYIAAGALYLCALVGSAAAAPHELPAPCVTGTLADYQALGSEGCSVGILRFNDFLFEVQNVEGGAIPLTAAQIIITPTVLPHLSTLGFSSSGFRVTGDEAVRYLIGYTADPHPEIFDYSLEMQTLTPVAPGFATIQSTLCIGEPYLQGSCEANPAVVEVFHRGGTDFDLTDSLSFRPVTFVGVRTVIDLQARGASSDIAGMVTGAATIPEPSSLITAACGGVALGLLRYFRRRASSRC